MEQYVSRLVASSALGLVLLVGCGHAPPVAPRTVATVGGVAMTSADMATARVLVMRSAEAAGELGGALNWGSGAFVDRSGLVATAAHVVRGARHIFVKTPGESEMCPAQVVFTDADSDLAILATCSSRHAVELAERGSRLQGAQPVDAVGYPGDMTRVAPHATHGAVVGIQPNGAVELGMEIDEGVSGGPVLDEHGRLVAIARAHGRHAHAIPAARVRFAMDEVFGSEWLTIARMQMAARTSDDAALASGLGRLLELGGEGLGSFEREARAWVRTGEPTPTLDALSELGAMTDNPEFHLVLAVTLEAALEGADREATRYRSSCRCQDRARQFALNGSRTRQALIQGAIERDPTLTRRSTLARAFAAERDGVTAEIGSTRSGRRAR